MSGFFEAIEHAYFNMFRFSGRSTRPQFWWFALFYAVVTTYLAYLAFSSNSMLILWWGLANAMPNWTLCVRRLHDTGKSGTWLFVSILPFGNLAIAYFLASPSDPRENRFGPPSVHIRGTAKKKPYKTAQTQISLDREAERKRIAHEYYQTKVLGLKPTD